MRFSHFSLDSTLHHFSSPGPGGLHNICRNIYPWWGVLHHGHNLDVDEFGIVSFQCEYRYFVLNLTLSFLILGGRSRLVTGE